ncbi:hypothetical protein BDP55DRAFT_322595 [Colletotrichum godetiae]|uniref:Uncharacterized protein n=1 Tax=Colletotrichum godetiae TaxID=1209918 RepID=A0AAJ0ET46_9PEZI|nr:uncharacterized protein BDP55DRAFT_322595 [Colletotrichum godetiae]KAK1660154.1 hypothetical protein BDP55DRAFT_322595 [Colletotrichum godetiae]
MPRLMLPLLLLPRPSHHITSRHWPGTLAPPLDHVWPAVIPRPTMPRMQHRRPGPRPFWVQARAGPCDVQTELWAPVVVRRDEIILCSVDCIRSLRDVHPSSVGDGPKGCRGCGRWWCRCGWDALGQSGWCRGSRRWDSGEDGLVSEPGNFCALHSRVENSNRDAGDAYGVVR